MQHQGQRCECMRSPAGILLLECQSRSRMVVALSAAPAMIPRERRRSLVADMRPCASGGRIVRTLGRSRGPAAHRPLQATEYTLPTHLLAAWQLCCRPVRHTRSVCVRCWLICRLQPFDFDHRSLYLISHPVVARSPMLNARQRGSRPAGSTRTECSQDAAAQTSW
jgi:hypothetical protein